MVVQHNLTAMNSNRNLGLTTSSQAKSTEKLSSGYKINRAADDAAGLSISEKMRKQIRGLTQASSNAEDGISAVQTAEGALNEVQDMLQRMNELAVKSANGTNSESDRSYIQNEVDQLTTEINRVAETTKFNETYLLKGDSTKSDYTYSYATQAAKAGTATMATAAGTTTGSKLTAAIAAPADEATAKAQNDLLNALKSTGVTVTTDNAKAATYTLTGYTVTSGAEVLTADGQGTGVTLTEAGTLLADGAGDAVKATAVTAGNAEGPYQFYDKDGNKIAANALDSYFSTGVDGTTISVKSDANKVYDATGNELTPTAAMVTNSEMTGALTLTLHVGADATSNNQISLNIKAMNATSLGVEGIKVDGADDKNALNAVDTIKEAIQKVSTQRSGLGAIQNRLEHTINNLDNVVENTTSAESAIRDTDMATEMVKYSNNNILSQAGQAMLAQANQSNQGVLSLLQ